MQLIVIFISSRYIKSKSNKGKEQCTLPQARVSGNFTCPVGNLFSRKAGNCISELLNFKIF